MPLHSGMRSSSDLSNSSRLAGQAQNLRALVVRFLDPVVDRLRIARLDVERLGDALEHQLAGGRRAEHIDLDNPSRPRPPHNRTARRAPRHCADRYSPARSAALAGSAAAHCSSPPRSCRRRPHLSKKCPSLSTSRSSSSRASSSRSRSRAVGLSSGPPSGAVDRKERRAVPFRAGAREQDGDLAPVDLVADDVEIGRAQRRHLASRRSRPAPRSAVNAPVVGEFLGEPVVEIGRGAAAQKSTTGVSGM